MVRLSSTAQAVAAIECACDIAVSAYMLHGGPLLRALEGAAQRGARVTVELEGAPYGGGRRGVARANRHVAAQLKACGAQVWLARGTVHAKVIRADGGLFLDGRNWGSGDFVLRDDDGAGLATGKPDALDCEAAVLAAPQSGDDAIVESESFGDGNPVWSALERLARDGHRPRLLVSARDARSSPRERAALARLARDGVAVRLCDDSEKFALAGNRAWIGSANASDVHGVPVMSDWGIATSDAAIVAAVRARLEARWAAAKPLR